MGLSADQVRRFARQIPLIGEDGQAALCAARVQAPAGDDPAESWARIYLGRAGVTVIPGGDAGWSEDEGALPELKGALFAAEAIARALGVRP